MVRYTRDADFSGDDERMWQEYFKRLSKKRFNNLVRVVGLKRKWHKRARMRHLQRF